MPAYLPKTLRADARLMVFVDGENLAIRFRNALGDREKEPHVELEKDVFVWSLHCNIPGKVADTIRQYYYTTVPNDGVQPRQVEERLKSLGIQSPRVFPKVRGTRRKQVDISLATEVLTHAHRDNYDAAILVAGDEDYVPLVNAVKDEGKRVILWFLEDGLSSALKLSADHYYNLEDILFKGSHDLSYLHLP